MPRFEPFPGFRYGRAITLDEVIAPPYDVVGPEERERLAARHPANAIHVELPVDDPAHGLDRYSSAARLFGAWIDQETLERDSPSMYVYRMTDTGGMATTGVLGALALEPSGGDVLPHEQTMRKDMTDRLELLRACRANLSPIWGLSLTPGLAKSYTVDAPADAAGTDDDGVRHELWVIDDRAAIEEIQNAVARSPVVIADGHHRYETALAYRQEQREKNGKVPAGHDLVMALVVELSEDQLSVGPIHRVIRGFPPGSEPLAAFGRWFESVPAGPPTKQVADELVARRELVLATVEGLFVLKPREEALRAARSDLDSSLVTLALEEVPEAKATYTPDPEEALEEVASRGADAAVLVRPVTVGQISAWAHERRRMPPKSTFFRPKPRTGMVFRRLEG